MATDWGSLKLRKFDLSTISDDATICFSAKRHSGKTFLVREILYTKRHFPAAMALAPTDKMTEFYTTFIPSMFVHYDFKPELLANLFQRQKEIFEKNKERAKVGKKPLDPRIVVVFDDCLSSKGDWAKDPNIAEIFFNGRHYKIMFMLTMQFPLGLKPEFRTNFDFVFLMQDDFILNQKRLYDHYAGMFPSFEMFRKVFMEVTDNYGCLVLNTRVKSKNILDKVFWYRASDPGAFMVGGDRLKKYNKIYYNPDWKNNNTVFDVAKYLKMKNKCDVKIELEDTDNKKKKKKTARKLCR